MKIRLAALCSLAVAAVQSLLVAIVPIAGAQTANPANPAADQPAAANPSPAVNPNPGSAPSGGGQLPTVVVTGYLIPRVGQGPQPVTTYDHTYIRDTGYQNLTDVVQTLPSATENFNPGVAAGFSLGLHKGSCDKTQ